MKDRSAKYHSGITMHALRVGGCVVGAVFTMGAMAIVLLGLPMAKWFLLVSVAGGIATFMLLRSFRSSN